MQIAEATKSTINSAIISLLKMQSIIFGKSIIEFNIFTHEKPRTTPIKKFKTAPMITTIIDISTSHSFYKRTKRERHRRCFLLSRHASAKLWILSPSLSGANHLCRFVVT
jgi:4-alpha-glucanotransferase